MASSSVENIHILLPSNELAQLRKRARAEKKSVAELIRQAIRKFYNPVTPDERQLAFKRLQGHKELVMEDWDTVKKELLHRHG